MVAFWQQLSWTRTIRWSLASSVSYSLLVDRRLSNSFSSKNSTFPENSVHLRSKKRHAYILNLKSTCLLIYWVCMRIKVIPADFKISYRINFLPMTWTCSSRGAHSLSLKYRLLSRFWNFTFAFTTLTYSRQQLLVDVILSVRVLRDRVTACFLPL